MPPNAYSPAEPAGLFAQREVETYFDLTAML